MPTPRRTPTPSASLADAVARQAPSLGLTLEREAPHLRKMIGVAFMAAAHSMTASKSKKPPRPPAGAAAEIKALIKAWAALHPKDVLEQIPKLALNPYIVVGLKKLQPVDKRYLRAWLKGAEFQRFTRLFPFAGTRDVSVSNLKVTFLGPVTAVVTFSESEKATNGLRYSGNAGAMVMKTEAGWRIAVISKQGVFGA